MLIKINFTTSAEMITFSEALKDTGLNLDHIFDENSIDTLRQALHLHKEKLLLNLKVCSEKNADCLLSMFFQKRIAITENLINQFKI